MRLGEQFLFIMRISRRLCGISLIFLFLFLFCTSCGNILGDPLTTESVEKTMAREYGQDRFTVKQLDSKHWDVSLKAYPGFHFKVTQKIGMESLLPLPRYKYSDNCMEVLMLKEGSRYFTEEEMKKFQYATGSVTLFFDYQNDKKAEEDLERFVQCAEALNEQYPDIVKGKIIDVKIKEQVEGRKASSPKMLFWGKNTSAEEGAREYLDAVYGKGRYKVEESDSVVHGERAVLDVVLTDCPDVSFSVLEREELFGYKKIFTDTRCEDGMYHIADYFSMPYENAQVHVYDDSEFVLYGGLSLDTLDTASSIVQYREKLKEEVDAFPFLHYYDYPKNTEERKMAYSMNLTLYFPEREAEEE